MGEQVAADQSKEQGDLMTYKRRMSDSWLEIVPRKGFPAMDD